MKKKILYFILGALTFTGIAYAAPSVIYQRHIRPESDNAWDLGASSSTWKGVFTRLASTSLLTISGLGNTGTECLQINNQGVVDNSGSGCGGGGTINSGTTNRLTYYSGATTLDSANFLALNTDGNFFGIGSTSPSQKLSVSGNAWLDSNYIYVGSSSAASTTIAYK